MLPAPTDTRAPGSTAMRWRISASTALCLARSWRDTRFTVSVALRTSLVRVLPIGPLPPLVPLPTAVNTPVTSGISTSRRRACSATA